MNMPLRKPIALFIPTLEGGGAERVMVMIANGLAATGLDVDLLVGCASGRYVFEIDPAVNLVDFDSSRVLFAAPKLYAYLRKVRPAVLLSALNHANIMAVALRSLASPKTRLVISVHNALKASDDGRRFTQFMRSMMKCMFRHADTVVTVSDGIRDECVEILGLRPESVVTVYNPLDVEGITRKSLEDVGHPWLDDDSIPVVLSVGRFTYQKNFPLLLRAFREVRDRVPSRLVILGEGGGRDELIQLITSMGLEEDVLLPGFQVNPYSWMRRSSVFVLPSRWEGLPGVLLEAMACGVPVVATDCETGPNEILEGGKWGRLVPVGDTFALGTAIVESLVLAQPHSVSRRVSDFRASIAVTNYLRVLGLSGAGVDEAR